MDYFTYTLFITGFISVVETDRFGIIPQHCSLWGYDVFYRPTNCIVNNPLIRQILEPRIGVNCSLIKMQPDYCGAWDLISYYADMMALCSETAAVNTAGAPLSPQLLCQSLGQLMLTIQAHGLDTNRQIPI